jgi:hypothetical protein
VVHGQDARRVQPTYAAPGDDEDPVQVCDFSQISTRLTSEIVFSRLAIVTMRNSIGTAILDSKTCSTQPCAAGTAERKMETETMVLAVLHLIVSL